MAKIIIGDFDLKVAQSISEILNSREGQGTTFYSGPGDEDAELALKSLDHHTIFVARDRDQILKILSETQMDLVFVNEKLLDDDPGAWVLRLRKLVQLSENAHVPFVFLSSKEEPEFVRRFMSPGVADLIFIPIDWPLFIQKFDLHLTKKVNTSDRQLYSQKLSHKIDMATIQEIEEISEFGLTIKSSLPINLDEFMVFYSEAFSASGRSEAIGRCYFVIPHPHQKHCYQASFMYVGIEPGKLQNIRKWLRQQYTQKKQSKG